jgi:hypothetical protein
MSSKIDLAIRLVLIGIRVELECRSIVRSLSRRGPKGETNALITAESEVMNFFRLLNLIRQLDSSMIVIGVEIEYRYVARLFSGLGPKGELNVLIAVESEVMDFLRWRRSCSCPSGPL